MKGVRIWKAAVTFILVLIVISAIYLISPFRIDTVVHGDVISAEATDWYLVRNDVETPDGDPLLPGEAKRVEDNCSQKGGYLVSTYNGWGGGETVCAVFKVDAD